MEAFILVTSWSLIIIGAVAFAVRRRHRLVRAADHAAVASGAAALRAGRRAGRFLADYTDRIRKKADSE